MNTFFKDMLDSQLSLESLDQLMIRSETKLDDISLEDGLFGIVKEICGSITNFFSGLFKRIKNFMSISKMLEEFWNTGTDKDLRESSKLLSSIINEISYADIAELKIPVSLGLNTPAVKIMTFINKEMPTFVKEYLIFLDEFDTQLSEYISIEDVRTRFSADKIEKKEKKVEKLDNELTKLINMKTGGSIGTIDHLYGSRDMIAKTLELCSDTYSKVNEADFKKASKMISNLKPKLDGLYELIYVEKEPVSKASLRAIISKIEIASNYTTVFGKLGLILHEVSIQTIKTVKVVDGVSKK